ncbi:MAG: hypothetical protein ACHQJ6_04320 [Candidatus Berkiellales bacterium]
MSKKYHKPQSSKISLKDGNKLKSAKDACFESRIENFIEYVGEGGITTTREDAIDYLLSLTKPQLISLFSKDDPAKTDLCLQIVRTVREPTFHKQRSEKPPV